MCANTDLWSFAEAKFCDTFLFVHTNMQVDRSVQKRVAAEFAEQCGVLVLFLQSLGIKRQLNQANFHNYIWKHAYMYAHINICVYNMHLLGLVYM